jgi:predicted GNAT superfamily acetyltransferase
MRAVDIRDIDIRDFSTQTDYDACSDLQCEVWGFVPAEAVPALHLVALHHYGGVLVGAFHADRMVGFVCGFTGWARGRVFHHSHMLAVLPDYRGLGLGEKLKWAQRDRVLDQGLSLINWTFDPLQAPNANLNINHLGAIVRKYRVDFYGESQSPLHGGIPTDRFEAEWLIERERVLRALRGETPDYGGWESLPLANPTRVGDAGLLVCGDDLQLALDDEVLLVEVPRTITDVMARDRELALDWRLKTRKLFQSYFERGYLVSWVHRTGGKVFYRVEQDEEPID